MKRLIKLVIIAVIFSGCNHLDFNENLESNKFDNQDKYYKYLHKVVYEDHEYIILQSNTGYGGGGICHSENCPCKLDTK